MNSYPIPSISNIIKKRRKNKRGETRPKPSKKKKTKIIEKKSKK